MKIKRTFTSIIFSLFFTTISVGQTEFGTVGSYWTYGYSSHSGNGYGEDMISVERDTLINGEVHKILRRTYTRTTDFITYEEYEQGSYELGTMLIKNDSVFVNDVLILDFTMEVGDTTYFNHMHSSGSFWLVADSITTVEINGEILKKWHLQKLCMMGTNVVFHYPVEIIEQIGQMGYEYLFWNLDGCLQIGGGSNSFHCYKNDDFQYLENGNCNEVTLVTTDEVYASRVLVFPNPVKDVVNIQLEEDNSVINEVNLFSFDGKRLKTFSANTASVILDISVFPIGIYFLEIITADKTYVKKILK